MNEYAVLKLVSGLTTVDLLNPPYALLEDSWSPQVASLDENRLSGKGLYTDVVEEIIIDISGSSRDELYDNGLDPLINLLNRADNWAQGKDVEPVILQVLVDNSPLQNPLQCLVVGKDGQSLINLPVSFNDYQMVYQIEGTSLVFKRRGQLLGDTERATAATVSTNPEIMSFSALPPLHVPGPTKICFTGFSASTPLMGAGFMAVTSYPVQSTNGTNFGLWQYDDFTLTNFTQTAETTYKAVGGNVLRIDASVNQTGNVQLSGVNAAVERLGVFVAARNNTSGTTWRIRAKSTGFMIDRTRWKVISDDDTNPHIFALGVVRSAAEYHTNIIIEVETDQTTGTLDINYAVTLPFNDDTQIISIFADDYSDSGFVRNVIFDPRPLTHRRGLAYVETET